MLLQGGTGLLSCCAFSLDPWDAGSKSARRRVVWRWGTNLGTKTWGEAATAEARDISPERKSGLGFAR